MARDSCVIGPRPDRENPIRNQLAIYMYVYEVRNHMFGARKAGSGKAIPTEPSLCLGSARISSCIYILRNPMMKYTAYLHMLTSSVCVCGI